MTKIVLEKAIKELNLVKVAVTSRYGRSWWLFNKAFRQSQSCYNDQWPLTSRYLKCWRSYSWHAWDLYQANQLEIKLNKNLTQALFWAKTLASTGN